VTFTTRPTLQGTFGMVSTTHWIASGTAMSVLERGGNAYDAAVAAGFVLHVVEPHLNGPGGDLPAIIALAGDDEPRLLCGQGPAPAAATIDRFRDLGYAQIPGAGPLAAALPGAIDAWLLLLRDHGTWTVEDVLEPAIGYARHGAPMVARIGDTVTRVQTLFERDWPSSAALWLPGGRPPKAGALHTNPAYAACLERVVAESKAGGGDRETQVDRARDAWYRGFVAEEIGRWADAGPIRVGDDEQPYLMTPDDLAAYTAGWEAPATVDVFGARIAKTPAWGQGPALLQALQTLAALDDPAALDLDTELGVHAALESLKLALADRDAWYGDTDDVPLDTLLSTAYARERAALIAETASHELRPGSPAGRTPRLPSLVTDPIAHLPTDGTAGEPTVDSSGRTRGDTCHIDVVDRWGNLVSATPSGGWLQSSPTIPALGFPLGSRMQMFWLEDGLPGSLRPGRRPRTTLSPTLVIREDGRRMACGTPGGDQQDQWQLSFLLRVLVGDGDLQAAIDAPSFHTLSMVDSFWPRRVEHGVSVVEDRIPASVLDGLRRRGHELRVSGPWSLGRLCAVVQDPRTGLLEAGANPRGMQGYAVGR
jgi:gamma-glutamyltranspeptidase/glutathione hydrolase